MKPRKIELNIIKEASIGSLALRAGKSVGSVAIKAGSSIGKGIIKHPIKSAGKLLTGAYIASTVKDMGRAGSDAFKNHPVINTSNINQNISNKITKIAEDDNSFKYNTDKHIDLKYAPQIAAGTITGLALASHLTGINPLSALAKGSLKGAMDVAKAVNTPVRVASKVVRKAGNIAKANKNEAEYLAREAIRKTNDFSGKSFKNINPDLFKKEIKDEVLKELLGTKSKSSSSAILEAIGRGAGFSGGAFAVHAIGDEYLKRRDKDELRSLLRESRDDNPRRLAKSVFGQGPRLTEHTYETPKQKADLIINMDKEAKFSPKKIVAVFTGPLAKDLLETSHRSLVKGSISTAAYMAVSSAKEKRRAPQSLSSPNRIVVEIPLSELNKRQRKKASLEEINIDKIAAINPKIKNFAIKNGKMALDSIAWTIPGIALAELKERASKRKGQNLLPLESGKARIIIETNNNADINQAHNDAYGLDRRLGTMKRASEELLEPMAKDLKNILIDEQEKIMARKKIALRNIELSEGIKGMKEKYIMNP